MRVIKDWGPQGIARLSEVAVHRAYCRMRRAECIGEAERMRYWMGGEWRKYVQELIVGNLDNPAILAADARRIVKELSSVVMQRHLEAEVAGRVKMG